MKIIYLTSFLLFIANISIGQLVISEISYNPPESGTDSLEYIELYNPGAEPVDLAGYTIADNNPHVIVEGTVPAQGYAILAINPSAIMSVLGQPSIPIETIALSNGGETITISDASGNVLDQVTYDDNAPWPDFDAGTDGAGASIELCDLDSDNNIGSNWGVSTNDLGVMINNRAILGTPNAPNSSMCEFVPDHTVEVSDFMFTPADITINVGESVRWTNIQGFHNVNGTQETYPDNPVSFGNGSAAIAPWTYDFIFENAGVYKYQCDPHANIGMVGTVTVMGDDNPEIPTYDIGDINGIDANGVGDSLGVVCSVTGIVHGANLRPSGLQFALIDNSGDALGLFSSSDLGYTYSEGDEIIVTGTITQFNGLLQIEPTEIQLLSSDNDLIGPQVVTTLDESTESHFVKIENATIVNPDDWQGDGGSFNVDFMLSSGNVVTIRIDGDTETADWAEGPVTGVWNILGIGGQYDNSEPYTEGYQMFPRRISDFEPVSLVKDDLTDILKISPNPVSGMLKLDGLKKITSYEIWDFSGKVIQKGKTQGRVDVSDLHSGIYYIKWLDNRDSGVLKFVKK